MNDLKFYQKKVKDIKNASVRAQRFEDAANWRDVERRLEDVIQKISSLENFLKYIKSVPYHNYDDIYKVIRPLDIIFQRKAKIEKLNKKL